MLLFLCVAGSWCVSSTKFGFIHGKWHKSSVRLPAGHCLPWQKMSVFELAVIMAHALVDFIQHPLVRGYLSACFISGVYSGYHVSLYVYNNLQGLPGNTGRVFRGIHTPFRQFLFVSGFSLFFGGAYVCKPFVTVILMACKPISTILKPVSKPVIEYIQRIIKLASVHAESTQMYDDDSTSADEDAAE
jgi:hypothetical protein